MRILLLLVMLGLLPLRAGAAVMPPGLYRDALGQRIYVGTENEGPDPPVAQYFNATNQHFGNLSAKSDLKFGTGIDEERTTIDGPGGVLGVSLWYVGKGARASIILIHGNDDETRDMGFLIPYFVLNGVNAISYDQRGTGGSTGNWRLDGPPQRAADVEAIYDAFVVNSHVDARRFGIWGFSNGGWTAPIVATQRPVAFMILKSAPADSIAQNIAYEVTQRMSRQQFGAPAISDALATWNALVGALAGNAQWDAARDAYQAASSRPWFAYSELPPHLTFPLSKSLAAGFARAVIYDPSDTLQKVTTPTLALYGALDRSVDVKATLPVLRSDFAKAGMRDFTVHVYRDAGHTLVVSPTGYTGDATPPSRLTSGYPNDMLDWLRQRSFVPR